MKSSADLCDRQRIKPCGCKLQRERYALETAANLGDRGSAIGGQRKVSHLMLRAIDEQQNGFGPAQ